MDRAVSRDHDPNQRYRLPVAALRLRSAARGRRALARSARRLKRKPAIEARFPMFEHGVDNISIS